MNREVSADRPAGPPAAMVAACKWKQVVICYGVLKNCIDSKELHEPSPGRMCLSPQYRPASAPNDRGT